MATKNKTRNPKKTSNCKSSTLVEIGSDDDWTEEDRRWSKNLDKKRKKYSKEKDPEEYAAFCYLRATGSSDGKFKTPFNALNIVLLANDMGFLPPPWASKLFWETIEDRLRGRINSLDAALGFSSLGKGKGNRTSPMLRQLIGHRNDMLSMDVYGWVVLDEGVDSACNRVISRLLATPNWNQTGYDLDLLKPKSKKHDLIKPKEEMISSLKTIYYKWKRMFKGPHHAFFLDAIKERVLKDPEAFMKPFA